MRVRYRRGSSTLIVLYITGTIIRACYLKLVRRVRCLLLTRKKDQRDKYQNTRHYVPLPANDSRPPEPDRGSHAGCAPGAEREFFCARMGRKAHRFRSSFSLCEGETFFFFFFSVSSKTEQPYPTAEELGSAYRRGAEKNRRDQRSLKVKTFFFFFN